MNITTLDAPTTAAPTTPTAPKQRSPAKKGNAAKAKTTKPKTAGARAVRDSDHPWLADAVRSARHLGGMKKDSGGDATVAYAGPGQHIKVRAHVTKALDGNVTPDAILGLTGVKTHKALREIATWSADKTAMTPMRPLSKTFAPDAWAQGRYLAAILVAWCDQLRNEAKAAKKS